jgi:hypothetical protein
VLVFKHGQVVETLIGVHPKRHYECGSHSSRSEPAICGFDPPSPPASHSLPPSFSTLTVAQSPNSAVPGLPAGRPAAVSLLLTRYSCGLTRISEIQTEPCSTERAAA